MSRIVDRVEGLKIVLGLLLSAQIAFSVKAVTLTNPIVFVTQPPIPRELNSSPSNTFLSVVTLFGNHLADAAHAARGGDLWLMTTKGGLVNLTRKAGFGASGVQHGVGIDVRDPVIHWSGKKVLFSMVVGSPTSASDTTQFFWQLYELTNLDAVIANTNTAPVIVAIPNQPSNCNNVTPTYATDGRIIFMSDRPYNNQPWLYPQRDEYKSAPSVTGSYSLDPANGDLRLLEHLPSGAFNPIIDSFGRLLVTRWDHLIRDDNATNDRLAKSNNGSFNFTTEASDAAQLSLQAESFPEPNDVDKTTAAQEGLNVNAFSMFLPWALDQQGGNEEVLNHVGRHELAPSITTSFTTDSNLVTLTSYTNRAAAGIVTANTNYLTGFFQIVEDPRTNGLYWGVDCQDISIFGGTHTAGQILTLSGGLNMNPTNMVINYITPKAGANGPNSAGLFRNPLPMSDGSLIAVYTPTPTTKNFGFDTNLGTITMPQSMYNFRLMTMTKGATFWAQNQFLTPGLTNVAIYYDGGNLITNAGPLWELQPVEVRVRTIPAPINTPVASIEAQVFAEEGVDLPTFQADLAQRNLALVISRNVTARDAADKQQPYNLAVPGGAQTIGTNSGTIYNITHLQFLEADYLRGYTFGTANVQSGRRVLATPLQATANFNYASSAANAPIGGTQIMSDGSQATIVPAGRALTWHLTGATNESVVKERYWITFRAGEVRTCANCHGINGVDQIGRPPPSNEPLALRELLRVWKTNAANAYSVTVNNGTGGGAFGAGTKVTLTAGAAPSGKVFANWTGAIVSDSASTTTQLVVPTSDVTVTAVYADLPSPNIDPSAVTFDGSTLSLTAQATASQDWVLQSSLDMVTWQNIWTNTASANGTIQFTNLISVQNPQNFFRLRSP
jgi:hypothetical protein